MKIRKINYKKKLNFSNNLAFLKDLKKRISKFLLILLNLLFINRMI